MKTAKEAAFKAYKEGLELAKNPHFDGSELDMRERFELWWSGVIYKREHRDDFHPDLNIFINSKQYMQID